MADKNKKTYPEKKVGLHDQIDHHPSLRQPLYPAFAGW